MDRNIYQATVKLAPNISTQSTKHILCALLRDDNHQLPNISQLAEIYNTTERAWVEAYFAEIGDWTLEELWKDGLAQGLQVERLVAYLQNQENIYCIYIYMYDMYIYIYSIYMCMYDWTQLYLQKLKKPRK